MKSVVLSTTEAEYMALSEVVKELKYILQTMNIEVDCPIQCMLTIREQSGYPATKQPVTGQSI